MRALAVLLLLPSVAFAETCGAWSAGISEEEGPGMVASVCVGTGTRESNLFLKCGPEDPLSLRFLAAAALDFPPGDGGDFSSPLRLSVDGEAFPLTGSKTAIDKLAAACAGS